jgi:UDP-N-acetylglucosamine 2-epimerase (non-hydrolysing)
MKVAPVLHAGRARGGLEQILLHTGQHYDVSMSDRFFHELGLPEPDVNLGVGSDTHAIQTGKILINFDPVLERLQPDWVVVYGDVNSTVACALAAVKRGIRVAHVEAGLRSLDRTMPEEINRIVTDQLADLCLTPSRDGNANLAAEGIPAHRVRLVGNVMVDTLLRLRPAARERRMPHEAGVDGQAFAVVTSTGRQRGQPGRPPELLEGLAEVARVMPCSPHSSPNPAGFSVRAGVAGRGVRLLALSYIETVSLVDQAAVVLTDSAGCRRDDHARRACLTLRPNTERPVTIAGAQSPDRILAPPWCRLPRVARRNDGGYRPGSPEGWDGQAGRRVVPCSGNPTNSRCRS